MLKFGFIGFGQVGGIFADSAKTYKYNALAINTANVDLKVLKNLEEQEKIHLIGYEGAGKDRSLGQEAFLNHEDMIRERISEAFQDCQVIFPIFALGGGTGSGMCAPATRLLTEIFEDKVISPILFAPHKNESPRAKMNALEAFSEISEIEDTGATFIIDNEKVLEFNRALPLKDKYDYTRDEFLYLLDYFNASTEKASDLTNLDKMDLLTTFSERGCAVISELPIDETDFSKIEKLGERLKKSWEYSIFAETDMSNISKSAIILDVPIDLTVDLKIEKTFDSIGQPLEIFTGIYEKVERPKLFSFVTGLPFPFNSLKSLEDEIKKDENRILKNLEKSRTQSFSLNSSWTNSLKRNRRARI